MSFHSQTIVAPASGGASCGGKQVTGHANGRPFDYRCVDAYPLVPAHVSRSHRVRPARARNQTNVSNRLNDRDGVFAGCTFHHIIGRDVPNGFRHQYPRRVIPTATYNL